ncbi:MAG: hypothetical protein A3E25_21330 [Burkholderiales bacterium RIFCSPHIGHO2_12_FULL_69_20]|nr:MAG: hypothetical protein A3E25_21330 [Burkholderiales bacterium RIFCSPHIGHO2_12_FULL_69_20]
MNAASHSLRRRRSKIAAAPARQPWRQRPSGRGVAALRLACALAAALLAGCAANPYTPPAAHPPGASPAAAASGPSARLLLRGSVPAQDRFAVLKLADALACKGPSLLIAGTPQKAPAPATLPAGVLTTLDFVILRAGKPSCRVRWSFTPVAGKTYLMQGLVVGSSCSARLLDVSAPERPVLPPDAALRSRPGQPCLPLAQARAATRAASSLIQGGQQGGEAVLNPRATTQDLQGLIKP